MRPCIVVSILSAKAQYTTLIGVVENATLIGGTGGNVAKCTRTIVQRVTTWGCSKNIGSPASPITLVISRGWMESYFLV